jgi:hypothetical protein
MQTETQKPQNQKNYENGPKHVDLQCSFASTRIRVPPRPRESCFAEADTNANDASPVLLLDSLLADKSSQTYRHTRSTPTLTSRVSTGLINNAHRIADKLDVKKSSCTALHESQRDQRPTASCFVLLRRKPESSPSCLHGLLRCPTGSTGGTMLGLGLVGTIIVILVIVWIVRRA